MKYVNNFNIKLAVFNSFKIGKRSSQILRKTYENSKNRDFSSLISGENGLIDVACFIWL